MDYDRLLKDLQEQKAKVDQAEGELEEMKGNLHEMEDRLRQAEFQNEENLGRLSRAREAERAIARLRETLRRHGPTLTEEEIEYALTGDE